MELGLHLYTHHFGQMPCDVNPGVYVVAEGFAGGVFKNSECETGLWGAWAPHTNVLTVGPVRAKAGVLLGGIVGYRAAPLLPLVVPTVAVQVGPLPWIRASYLPTHPTLNSVSGVHFSIEYSF
jgi:hypothetical protein